MDYSDDDGEDFTLSVTSVTNYHFVDDTEEPICFSVLPILWSARQRPETTKQKIFLYGVADSGPQKIYKHVIAWKVDLSYNQPEVSILSKEKLWIKLLKPRKSFEDTIKTILTTLHCLHFVKKNPATSGKSLWKHLGKVPCLRTVRPSDRHLLDHISLISSAVKHDRTLAKSKYLTAYLENPRKRKLLMEDLYASLDSKKAKLILDDGYDESDDEIGNEVSSDEQSDLFDPVCSICDNGGDLLICDGSCFRSFHATVDAGSETSCKSLGLSKEEVEAPNFLCLNCQYKQHQCFACGKLGSSDMFSGAEVFRCISSTCGHFYHPECVAKLLHPENPLKLKQLQKNIAAGESFTCPVHKCFVCKQEEDQEVRELQFAVCRRCPRAYHRKCLPRKISFKKIKAGGIDQRAWNDLLPNRVLIYCLKHKIDRSISTPTQDHIIFPEVRKNKNTSVLRVSEGKVVAENKVNTDETPKGTAVTSPKQVAKSSAKTANLTRKNKKLFRRRGLDSSEKLNVKVVSEMHVKDIRNPVSLNKKKSCTEDVHNLSLREEMYNLMMSKDAMSNNPEEQHSAPICKTEKTLTHMPSEKKLSSSHSVLDAEAEKRIMDMMKAKESSITLEDVKKNYRVPYRHVFTKKVVSKSAVRQKVECSVEDGPIAFEKVEEDSILDSKSVCAPETLTRITQLKVADKIQCYIQNGDKIVDFCSGSTEFTCFLKQKLKETGKRCSFKTYGLSQIKNGFTLKNADWMNDHWKELPTGSQLIMGISSSFRIEAADVSNFVKGVLEFKPKLFILTVPTVTERLDEKEVAYNLIFEDSEQLSEKPYFPGSVDITDEQLNQWNLKPPLISLWSRADWTAKYKNIAQRQGLISKNQKDVHLEDNHKEVYALDDSRKEDHGYCPAVSKQENVREDAEETREVILPDEHIIRNTDRNWEADTNNEGQRNDGSSMTKNTIRHLQEGQEKQNPSRGINKRKEKLKGKAYPYDEKDSRNLLEGSPSRSQNTPSVKVAKESAGQMQLVLFRAASGESFQDVNEDIGTCDQTHYTKELDDNKYSKQADKESQLSSRSSSNLHGIETAAKAQSSGMFKTPGQTTNWDPELSVFSPCLLRPLSNQYRSGGWLDD